MPTHIGGLIDRVANRFARHVPGARADILLEQPIVSFSFDDAPMTAATHGATILERNGARGTFYLAGSMLGITANAREFITAEAAASLAARGHELACHTFSHSRLRDLSARALAADLDRNAACLDELDGGRAGRRNFAIPYTMAWPPANSGLRARFSTVRGGAHGINRGASDLLGLRAVELRENAEYLQRATHYLNALAAQPGWLIFFTHDVADMPGEYGCKPETLSGLVEAVKQRGYPILPVADALQSLSIAA